MKEITPDVFIETTFEGTTVGAIRTPEGVVMVDVPLVNKDIQSWQAACARTSSGSKRIVVLLDEHPDRTAGAKLIRCPIITHSKTAKILTSQPSATKMQGLETGAIWETIPEICTIEWPHPEITFSNSIAINWSEQPILVEHHPGPTSGSSWVIVPDQKIVFVGDAVTPDQPPFLSSAEIEPWIEALDILKSSHYKDYLIISGRAELVTMDDIRQSQKFLRKTHRTFDKLNNQTANLIKIQKSSASFIDDFKPKNRSERELYLTRLSYGFTKYYINNFSKKKL
ncbi:MAG: MBL fold metallo-hydrolase [Pelolinea sp.]|nr:MBL fold metallo-hydrolase [Pelolinea sp.]